MNNKAVTLKFVARFIIIYYTHDVVLILIYFMFVNVCNVCNNQTYTHKNTIVGKTCILAANRLSCSYNAS